ncbi:MAG: hypothetical protein HQ592_02510 [Planctomycetes bacterium]|nr:hypothetical protein [Planctomycetota bacterium]
MKARLIPVRFGHGNDETFNRQLRTLTDLLEGCAEVLDPVALGKPLPEGDAVVLPQLSGQAYRQLDDLKGIDLPVLTITTGFGTMSMWDWELISCLKAEGVRLIAPYNLDQARSICAALGARRRMAGGKFVVFAGSPREVEQASRITRFYWWQDECSRRIAEKFGISIVVKSLEALGARAQEIPDQEAEETWRKWQWPTEGIDGRPLLSAVKMYIAIRRELEKDPTICGIGVKCLSASRFSDTTPCLAWCMLYEEKQLMWGCEADTMSMLSKYILHKSLGVPIMMTNIYPFLMGDAALKHERIERFPDVEGDPANHVLLVHCGYMGVIPKSFAAEWTLRRKVLAMVHDNATAVDARFPTGDITLAKLDPTLSRITAAEGELKGYAQFPGSDCRNGGVIEVRDGHKLMASLVSHHYLVMTGHHLPSIRMIAGVFGLEVEEV